jgi:periplasmic divalent cation tolerance protein
MSQKNIISILYTTVASQEDATVLAQNAIENHLAACVNFMPQITSMYRWKDNLETATEYGLLFKTSTEQCAALQAYIEANHPYSTPAILITEVSTSNAFYQFCGE